MLQFVLRRVLRTLLHSDFKNTVKIPTVTNVETRSYEDILHNGFGLYGVQIVGLLRPSIQPRHRRHQHLPRFHVFFGAAHVCMSWTRCHSARKPVCAGVKLTAKSVGRTEESITGEI